MSTSIACGIMRRCLEESVAYAKERPTFGPPIANHQLVQAMIAEMAIRLNATRLLVHKAAWSLDKGIRDPLTSACAKAFGADAFVATGDDEVARIRAVLGGEPDVVFECAGVPGMLAKSIEHVRRKGIVMSLGFCTSDDPVVPGLAGMKQVQLCFAVAYTLGGFEHAARELDRDALPDPRVIVSDTFGLDAFPGVIDELRGPNDHSKVQLDPWA